MSSTVTPPVPTPLAGRTAVVTGASRGIGAGIARELARRGAAVAITYNSSPDRARDLVQQIEADGGRAFAIQADHSTAEGARGGITQAVAALGSLDILVNNAGVGWFEPFGDATQEHVERTIDINVRGTLAATQEALAHLSDGGRIVTIGSITGASTPFPGGAVYGASKSALVGFTKGLARDLGARAITANVIQPGPIDTEGNPDEGDFAVVAKGLTALGRFGSTTDVGHLVAWLASDEAAYMTGAVITLDGGWSA